MNPGALCSDHETLAGVVTPVFRDVCVSDVPVAFTVRHQDRNVVPFVPQYVPVGTGCETTQGVLFEYESVNDCPVTVVNTTLSCTAS